jgi:multidrug efflux pump subunit AcrA (membrane-fusion protein)
MRMKLATLPAVALAAFALAGCDSNKNQMLQGWVEAELIFVSPDEQGRVETLKVREGDRVEKGALLFGVDDDLQQADVVVKNAAVTTAQQAFDRAKVLLKTASGTQKNYDDAEAALRQANANLAWSQTRLTRRRALSPVDGAIQQVYYRPGETVPAGSHGPGRAAGGLVAAARQSKNPLLCAAGAFARDQVRRDGERVLRWLREGADCQSELHRAQRRIHSAGDLQPG